ncbi:MAG: hypothetical protein A3B99_03845 [Candidatus Yanofskybacteria bacterium RIFCSPHIGHO2_02_FULL_44_12b]|uniref:Metallopeptidase domain-containing protein n=2 Tax=Candidatus Yanofskyibacteriota TaxID=1752733 RepID=A0A1F8GPX7_9BACT|nr:MAG: hypothetical protein UW79_C0035G0005 [Candidatus Yanofskybacteria bacterium GW2011_GWA2_44_9]OGN04683.1 MAG: hypothetical protein A2659_00995 [Candidatus Yanofskybacteria bacterium RIFCSPHIGHO2_01_FULL_44_24]OGN15653.1 MAG: hypothetical protein A3B99_03845 [Candidatus Yanofskybacteria bacterium RIFCSPHIGHO2_02_FULL_44_12b]OGN26708.1 MAG: hypothetical protein A2925_03930 [Candidatus Yanofskybacteria bacterium RIFCSPLOWO2_01_FULL_44_22]
MSGNKAVRERIIRERVQLLLHRPFFGYLTLSLDLKEELGIPTMATDGTRLYYNPAFVDGLDPKVLQMILAHETLHCALGHLWRLEKRNREKWNYATDYAINLMLKKEGFTVPANCLCDDKFDGMSAEEIYHRLPDQKPKGSLVSSHDKWPGKNKCKDKENKKASQTPQDKSGEGGDKKPENQGQQSKDDSKEDGSGGDNKDRIEGDQPQSAPPQILSGDDQEELVKEWQDKLIRAANAARMQGKLPGRMGQLIQDVLEPKLDWKVILKDLVTSLVRNDFRLFPASKKHLWRNIYLPSLHGELIELAVGIDTSGSVSDEQFQELIAEVRGIAEQFENFTLHLFFCDTEIHDRMTISSNDVWPDKFTKNGGGTSFVPVIELIDKELPHIAGLVYLTDGDGAYPKNPPDYPVIWVLNKDKVMPWGESIKMEEAR